MSFRLVSSPLRNRSCSEQAIASYDICKIVGLSKLYAGPREILTATLEDGTVMIIIEDVLRLQLHDQY